MESSPPAKPRWKRLWTYDMPYHCPRCGEGDSARLPRFGHSENATWACPHCQAKLTILEKRRWVRLLYPLPILVTPLTSGLVRWQRYATAFLAIAFCFWLASLLSRPQVALMPGPKDWT